MFFAALRCRARFFDRVFYVGVVWICLWREVAVGFALVKQLDARGAMLVGIIGLKDDLLIRLKTDPRKALEDRARRFVGRAREVRVLDPKQELAALLAGRRDS